MKLMLLVVSEKMPKWVDALSHEYLKRFSSPFILELIVVPAPKRYPGCSIAKIKEQESALLLQKIPANAFCILMDERGKLYDSVQFSAQLEAWTYLGRPLVFVIGGADGFDEALYQRAQAKWALSPLTFVHAMARVLTIEQLYRATSLLKGHPYHRV